MYIYKMFKILPKKKWGFGGGDYNLSIAANEPSNARQKTETGKIQVAVTLYT